MVDLVRLSLIHLGLYYIKDPDLLLYCLNIKKTAKEKNPRRRL